MFTIRVYGICIEDQKVLVSDEYIHGHFITKFPGGGLHFGEGTVECLVREMTEETGQQVEVLDHFYTTDFFQASVFDPSKQVLSIYYRYRFIDSPLFQVREKVFDFPELKEAAQSFRWIPLKGLRAEDFTLPIDQRVGGMLVDRFGDQK